MTIKDRLLEYIKLNKIPIARFERACRMSNGYMNSIRKSPGVEKLDNILSAYPDINRDWLLTGNGDMTHMSTSKCGKTKILSDIDYQEKQELVILKKEIIELKKENVILKEERNLLIKSNSKLSTMLQDIIYKRIKIGE